MKQGEYVNNITGTADANGVTSLELTTKREVDTREVCV